MRRKILVGLKMRENKWMVSAPFLMSYILSAMLTIFFIVLQYGSHSKKRPNNLVIGRTYDYHIYDLVEVGVENFKSMEAFSYDKKLAPKIGSKPFFAFIGEGFESVEELKHLKEMLLDLFHGEVCIRLLLHYQFFPLLEFEVCHLKWDLIFAGCDKFKPCWIGSCLYMHSSAIE